MTIINGISFSSSQLIPSWLALRHSITKLRTMSLVELLHKPVARVQKNALVLHDLLKYTPESHQEYKSLKTALKMTQVQIALAR